MKSQVIEYQQKNTSRQQTSSFPIRPLERISKTLIAHHLNLPLILQDQSSRQDYNKKRKLFKYDQDYNEVKRKCETIENQYQTILTKVTDLKQYDRLQNSNQVECYIKNKQQIYTDLIEHNLDTFRNLKGNKLRMSTYQDESPTLRNSSAYQQQFKNRPQRIQSLDVNKQEKTQNQQINHPIFQKQQFQKKDEETNQPKKEQYYRIDLESNWRDDEINDNQSLRYPNTKPSVQLQSWNHQILLKQKQTRIQVKIWNKKFRVIVFVVIAALEIAKKYKLIFEKREIAKKHFQAQQEPHIKYINYFGLKQHKTQHRQFVESLLQKILTIQKDKIYIEECKSLQQHKNEIRKDIQKQRLCLFIKLLFQDLELITRKDLIPPFILHTLNLCLFSRKNIETSQFVVNRTQFYSKTVHHLTSEQRVLIAMEYLIFNIIIPNLLEIPNNLDKTNQDYFFITLFHFIAITGVLMISFTNYFEKLTKIRQSNVNPIQRFIQIKKNEQGLPIIADYSINNKLEENENLIMSGGFEYNALVDLFQQKPFFQRKGFLIIQQNCFECLQSNKHNQC